MAFGKHVFISYAHLDNEEGPSKGWINRFHSTLSGALSQRYGTAVTIWRDAQLKPNDVFEREIVEQLPDTAVLVSVITPRYLLSPWCMREAETFCEVAQQPPGLVVQNKSRIFKVVKTPLHSQDALPAPMRETLGMDFYVRIKPDMSESKDENDPPLELDSCYSPELERKFNVSVMRLAHYIFETLQILDGATGKSGASAATAVPKAESADRPAVYLAECAYDRRSDRASLGDELRMRGYPVLPDKPLPQDEAEYRAEVARLLERCALSIHLVGAVPGLIPDGPGQESVVQVQNEQAVARARQSALRRVISLPAGTQSGDPKHAAFIERLHSDQNAQFAADLITGDLQAVKGAIGNALTRLETPAPAPAADAPAGRVGSVYVIYDERDRKDTVDLRKALAARNLDVLTPVFEGDARAVRTENQDRLTRCDAVLIYYGQGTEAWKASVENDVRRSAALRQGRQLRGVFTWIGKPLSAAKADAIEMGQTNLIDGLNGFSPDLVEPIVAALTGPGRG